MSGGCDFHAKLNSGCVHCLGHAWVLARTEATRLREWIEHLVEHEGKVADLLMACRDWFESPGGEPGSSELLDRINAMFAPSKPQCRYCGWALPAPPTDDPRSWECSDCLAKAQGTPEQRALAEEVWAIDNQGDIG